LKLLPLSQSKRRLLAFCLDAEFFFIFFDEQIEDLNGVDEHGLLLFSVDFERVVFQELSQVELGHGGEGI
jgi:hypothetical protein